MEPNQNQNQNQTQLNQDQVRLGQDMPTPPQQLPQAPAQSSPPVKLSRFLLPLIVIFILLLIVAVTVYFANQQAIMSAQKEAAKSQLISPTIVVSENEQDLQNIDVGNIEKDFQDIQADVDKL